MSCRLIINADDLGWSSGVNRAVWALHDAGVVTAASLMVGAPAAADAVSGLRQRPSLAVGLHLAVVGAPPVLPPSAVSSLVDDRGWLRADYLRAGLRYTLRSESRRELRREVEAQFAAFAALGLPWSHVDTHLHMSLTPGVRRELLRAAAAYPVLGMRVPEDDYALYRTLYPREARRGVAQAAGLAFLCRLQRRALRGTPYVAPRRCYGFFRSGRLTPAYLAALAASLPDGLSELHCHPDLDTESGRAEVAALLSPELGRSLAQRGARLTTFCQRTGPCDTNAEALP